ncbi:MAG: MoaD/ThiS family protein [Flavobacteriales bacterium]|nr:MoaD/ThiS family protein [Flavobacteriales bacterium]
MRVKLFGMIAEKAGSAELEMEASSLKGLCEGLRARIRDLDSMSFAIAVDRRIVKDDLTLTGTEEIAVLPPFAGG